MHCFRKRWGVAYDLQLVIRADRLYLQIMWGYLEQKSFPLEEVEFKLHLNKVLEIVNRLGFSSATRNWLTTVGSRPRLGRAVSLELKCPDELIKEFIL